MRELAQELRLEKGDGPAHWRAGMSRGGIIAAVFAVICVLACRPAQAAESLYWNWATLHPDGTYTSGIAAADLVGGLSQNLALGSAPVDHPLGVVVDSATGTLYWA